jgi:hypothetical protein
VSSCRSDNCSRQKVDESPEPYHLVCPEINADTRWVFQDEPRFVHTYFIPFDDCIHKKSFLGALAPIAAEGGKKCARRCILLRVPLAASSLAGALAAVPLSNSATCALCDCDGIPPSCFADMLPRCLPATVEASSYAYALQSLPVGSISLGACSSCCRYCSV